MIEPIPFVGNVDIEDTQMSKEEIETMLKDMLGDDPQSDIKYVVLADGATATDSPVKAPGFHVHVKPKGAAASCPPKTTFKRWVDIVTGKQIGRAHV